MKMPISRGGNARFRGPTSSQEYNLQEDNVYHDLLELYQQSNQNYKSLKEAYNAILAEHVALQSYSRILEDKINQVEQKLVFMKEDNFEYNGKSFSTGYSKDMRRNYLDKDQDDNTQERRSSIQKEYRFASLPASNQIPKTFMYGLDGEIFLPKELKVEVKRLSTSGEVQENDVMNAFNGDNTSYWRREVIYEEADAPKEEVAVVEVDLPLALSNSLDLNTIVVHPHPERGIEVSNVEIHYNNAWQQIDGFKQKEFSSERKLSPKRKWYFEEKPVQRIRVTLVQRNPLSINNKKMFVLGAQKIEAYYTTFEAAESFVLTPVDMSYAGVYSIESVEHIFSNSEALTFSSQLESLEGDVYDFELMEENRGLLTPISESQWSSQILPKIWVKTTLRRDKENGVSPCLHGVRIHYTKA